MRKVAKQQLFPSPTICHSIPNHFESDDKIDAFHKIWVISRKCHQPKKIWLRAYQQSGLEKGLKRGWGWLSCKTLKLSLASLSIIGYATLVCASIKPQMTAECPPFLKCYLFDCKKKRNKSDWRIVKVDLHCLKKNARERLLIRFVTWLIMQSP